MQTRVDIGIVVNCATYRGLRRQQASLYIWSWFVEHRNQFYFRTVSVWSLENPDLLTLLAQVDIVLVIGTCPLCEVIWHYLDYAPKHLFHLLRD